MGILIIGDMQVYYIEPNGDHWDEIRQKKPDQAGVRNARLEEMTQIHQHDGYTGGQRGCASRRQARNL